MNKHITKFVLVLGLFLATAISLGHTENVSAEKVSINISPTDFRLELDPGKTYTEKFTVENRGDNEVAYKASVSPYQQLDKDGGETEATYTVSNEYTEIVDWITIVDGGEGVIPVGEKATIVFSISVPKDAPGGGQYAVPFVSTVDKSSTDGNTSLGQSLSGGPVIYASVNGTTNESAEIKANDIEGFLFSPPFKASTTVVNKGNIHAYATQVVKVYPMFSNESIYNNEESPSVFVVLPGNTKYNSVNWTAEQGAPSIGIYKVVSEVKIFNEVSKVEKTVIVCPMWVLILILVFIAAAIFWIVSRVKSRKAES